jgi:hypothetical protein
MSATHDITTTITPSNRASAPPAGSSASGSRFDRTLEDPGFHAGDSRADLLVSVRHVTQVQEIDERLERNQQDLAQPALVPGFKLLHRIGKGAFGTVWEAHSQDNAEERVAIKFFTLSQWEPMYREVSRIARLEGCTGVMPFKQYADKKADPPYYVMPFAQNGSLADLLKSRGRPLKVAEALPIFNRLVETMAFVHAKGVIHCDLKPANILMNEGGEPLVADFGQAQLGSQEPGSFGTLFYMPPEQADVRRSLPETNWDVYALGAILFEMLAGRKPRDSDDLNKQLRETTDIRSRLDAYRRELERIPKVDLKRHVRVANPSQVGEIDAGLDAIVEDCLAIDPARRPRSAGQLRERLQKRLVYKHRRAKLGSAAVATCILFLLVGLLGVLFAEFVYRERRKEQTDFANHTLSHTAHIAGQLVGEILQDRVTAATHVARDLEDPKRSDLAADLATLRDQFRADPAHASGAVSLASRRKYADWLRDEARSQMPWYEAQSDSRAVGIQLVVDRHLYLLAQVDQTGEPDLDPADERWRDRFDTDWSWRDYYAGQGNLYAQRGQEITAPPISRCIITQAYQSKAKGNPMRIDVAAPVKDADGQTIAIVILAIDLKSDLLKRIGHDPEARDAKQGARSRGSIVLVNDRHCWAAHPLAWETKTVREKSDPEPVYKHENWTETDEPVRDRYFDPVLGAECEAAYVHTRPFKGLNDDRRWTVIAQMSQEVIDEPARNARWLVYWLVLMSLLALGGVVIALWIWWLRTMKRQELLIHG